MFSWLAIIRIEENDTIRMMYKAWEDDDEGTVDKK